MFLLVLSTLMLPLETLVTVSRRFCATALGALRVSWFGVVRVLRGHLGGVRVFSLVLVRHATCCEACLSDLYLARVPVRVVLFGVVLSQVASNAPRAVFSVGMLVVISQRAAFTVFTFSAVVATGYRPIIRITPRAAGTTLPLIARFTFEAVS